MLRSLVGSEMCIRDSRISVRWNAPAELIATITASASHIADEVLALSFEHDAAVAQEENELGVGVVLKKA